MRRGCRMSPTLQQLICQHPHALWAVGRARSWAATIPSLRSKRGLGSLAEAEASSSSSSLDKSLSGATAVDSPFPCASSASFDALRSVETGRPQLTLRSPVTRAGVGLHSGEVAELRLLPAAAGSGRYFVVGDSEESENCRIPAMLDYVRETTLSTCLGRGNLSIRSVEHLLSALEGLGVDNCRIEIRNGREASQLQPHVLPMALTFPRCKLLDSSGSPGRQMIVRHIQRRLHQPVRSASMNRLINYKLLGSSGWFIGECPCLQHGKGLAEPSPSVLRRAMSS